MPFPIILTRRKSGTKDWVQCNSTPVKLCKLPVHELTEGESYHFRVRAVNSAGISLPSRMSSGVTTADVESDVEGSLIYSAIQQSFDLLTIYSAC